MAKHLLGKNLKYLRKQTRQSQANIGVQVGKSYTSVGNWETGFNEPSLDDTIEIASYFGVLVDELLKKDMQEGGVSYISRYNENASKGGDQGGDQGGDSNSGFTLPSIQMHEPTYNYNTCKECAIRLNTILEKTATITALQETIRALKDNNATLNSLIREMGQDKDNNSKRSAAG